MGEKHVFEPSPASPPAESPAPRSEVMNLRIAVFQTRGWYRLRQTMLARTYQHNLTGDRRPRNAANCAVGHGLITQRTILNVERRLC